MFALQNTQPALHEHFMKGMHTVRRSDRFWAGLSTDLVIEQTLMKSIKGRGGLSHGRGFDENVAKLWLKSRGECAKINSVMNDLVGLSSVHSEHTDVSKARIARDTSDVMKIWTFLDANSPFRFADCTKLISLISGVSLDPTTMLIVTKPTNRPVSRRKIPAQPPENRQPKISRKKSG
jgi:hypothetical protein